MRDGVNDFTHELGRMSLRLLKERDIHGRVEDVQLFVNEQRLRSAKLVG